ncbi:twitching mobility protein [Abditibacteriota bacterium]|nr:twitching mobility protein [Abditibacteriota bacterium]
MAQIDQLIGMMSQRHAERVMLINDQPMQMFIAGVQTAGTVVPGAALQNILNEITPPHLRQNLSHDGGFSFSYQSAHGPFDIKVGRNGPTTQMAILPHGTNGHGEEVPTANAGMPPRPAETIAAVPKAPAGSREIGHIDELFRFMKQVEASDLHLTSDEQPILRIHGKIDRIHEYKVHNHDMLQRVLFEIIPERNREQFEAEGDTDFAYEIADVARFRCNYFMDRKGMGAVFRLIPSDVLTADQLKLERAILDLCFLSKGLVVVTGPTGSGKSTTLAAMVDFINKNRDDHIITIEDPVEFVHKNIKCLVNQREVHVHTESFKRALRAALREDPDIVLVGEMRDLETIAIAIETAETGHLVFGTLHTTTAPSTVDRIIDQFPADQQAQIRVMLSESLKGVIAQTLLRTVDGKRVAAHEILLCPPAVANLIREGKTFQLPSQMQVGKSMGMLTMNDSILEHVKKGRVAPHEGYVKAVDKTSLLDSYLAAGIDYNPSSVGDSH